MNRLALSVLAICLLAGAVPVADFTWTGGVYVSGNEATRYWDLADNWNPSGVPTAGQAALIDTTSNYAIANADLPGSPAIEVTTGGAVVHQNGATLTMPITLSGGTWHTSPWWNSSRKYDGTWQTNRTVSGPVTVTAPSFIKGTRGTGTTISGQIDGSALLTFRSDDAYGSQGPNWTVSHTNDTFSGGVLIEAGNSPTLWATASQALGTGDITVRSTGTLVFGANQDYSQAVRTPVLYLEGGSTAMTDHLSGATIPFNVVVQSQGGTLGAGTWASNCVYSGSVTLNGPLTLAGARGNGGSTNFTITGAITGNQPVTVNTIDYYQGGRGIVTLANAANTFASLTLQRGYLKVTSEGALSSGPITLYNPTVPEALTKFYLDKTPNADWTISNSLAGAGTIQVETGTGSTLTTSGPISPGIGDGNAATITIQGNLGFATGAALTVDLNGVDPVNPAGDRVTVTGEVSGLADATLSVVPVGDVSAIAGREFTILSCANDLTGQSFADVVVPEGWAKVIVYTNGAVKVTVAPNTGDDIVAPAAVTDLAAGSATLSSLTLTWTAPGDDGILGTAVSYDIRYSTSAITEANWAEATPVTGVPVPAAGGTAQSVVVSGLTMGTTYYFAMKASDEVPNVSSLSNVTQGQTDVPDTFPPAVVMNLAASLPSSNSLTLTWTAPGDNDNTGTATSYDIRYSTSTIDENNWASATQVTGEPTPTAVGTIQTMVISGLSNSTAYYFAMKTSDEIPNVSTLSNVASGTTAPPDPSQAYKRILSQADFKYKGHYKVQSNGDHNQLAELNYGQGFTHRYVNGQLRFLTFSFFGNVAGGGYHLIEFAAPAALGGTVTTRTNHWPDIWTGTGLSSGGVWLGLWYEQAKNRLWNTWAIDYPDDVQALYTKTLAIRTLNDDGTISDGIGPWGLEGVQQRRIYGGVTAIPQWFQDFYQVGPYAAGWGGYASRMGRGASMGPTFYAIPEPTTYPTGESSIPTSAFKTIMDHSGGTTSSDWYASGFPTSFDRGVRNSDVQNDYDAPNWQSPAPDGLGRWTWGDSNWNTGCWIDTPTRHGFITVPKLCNGRTWYETSTLHCERQSAEIQVFDPKMLGEAARGTRASWNTYPASRWEITSDCTPFGLMWGRSGNGPDGGPCGASYDATTRELYVYCVGGTGWSSYILVYDVGPIPGDVNADDYVNVGDLQGLVAAWGSTSTTTPPSANWNSDADLTGDGYINVGDLQLLVAHWGEQRQ